MTACEAPTGTRWPGLRAAFERERGPIPAGHHLHHACGVSSCRNLGHLVVLPAGEHIRGHWAAWRAGGDEWIAPACPHCGDLVDGDRCACGAQTQ